MWGKQAGGGCVDIFADLSHCAERTICANKNRLLLFSRKTAYNAFYFIKKNLEQDMILMQFESIR
jgi:hypothetical protein